MRFNVVFTYLFIHTDNTIKHWFVWFNLHYKILSGIQTPKMSLVFWILESVQRFKHDFLFLFLMSFFWSTPATQIIFTLCIRSGAEPFPTSCSCTESFFPQKDEMLKQFFSREQCCLCSLWWTPLMLLLSRGLKNILSHFITFMKEKKTKLTLFYSKKTL